MNLNSLFLTVLLSAQLLNTLYFQHFPVVKKNEVILNKRKVNYNQEVTGKSRRLIQSDKMRKLIKEPQNFNGKRPNSKHDKQQGKKVVRKVLKLRRLNSFNRQNLKAYLPEMIRFDDMYQIMMKKIQKDRNREKTMDQNNKKRMSLNHKDILFIINRH